MGFLTVVRFGSFPLPSPPPRPQVVSLSRSSYESPVELTDGRGEGEGAKSIRQRESLVLYNPITALWFNHSSTKCKLFYAVTSKLGIDRV